MTRIRAVALLVGLAVVLWLIGRDRATVSRPSGTIEAYETHVASMTGGRVSELFVREGDAVTNGQVILALRADEWRARRDRAAAALAELESGPRTQEIAAARAEWEALEAEHRYALDDARRKRDLAEGRVVATADRDESASRATSLRERADAARQRYETLLEGARPEQIAQARAQLAEAEIRLDELIVRAPAEAVLETLHVRVGDVVAPNAPVATLLLAGERWVRVYVPETWLSRIRVGQRVGVHVDGLPGETFEGVVDQVARKAEFTPRNVQTPAERVKQVFGVKVRLAPDERLRAGLTAEIAFPES